MNLQNKTCPAVRAARDLLAWRLRRGRQASSVLLRHYRSSRQSSAKPMLGLAEERLEQPFVKRFSTPTPIL